MTSHFDKERIAHIQSRVEDYLYALGIQEDVRFTVGHASFTDTNCRIQLDVDVIRDGKVVSQEAEDWKRYAEKAGFGFGVGSTFEHHELGRCQIVGWSRRKRKFPVIVRQADTGKRYKMSVSALKMQLALAKPEEV